MSARDGALARLVGDNGPSEPVAAQRWATLDHETQRRLRRAATDPAVASHLHQRQERWLVDELAAERVGRRPADLVVPVVTGLLVLSTLWGFGRATQPEAAGWWLAAGIVGLVVVTLVGWRRAAVRRADARAVRTALRTRPPGR